jgi:RNA polymerase sigma-70 factor (ECF subfamily)
MRDSDSFDEFYRTTSVRLTRYGYTVTGDLAEAQDLVQEAYTRAWQRWRTVAEHPNPEAWVRLVVTRLANDRWRRMGRWRAALRGTSDQPGIGTSTSTSATSSASVATTGTSSRRRSPR